MQILKIHSMRWSSETKHSVFLTADTDTGDNELIATLYGPDSAIWDALQTFPVDQIGAYEPPPVDVADVMPLEPKE